MRSLAAAAGKPMARALAQEPGAGHRELGRKPIDITELASREPQLDDPIERLQIRIVQRHQQTPERRGQEGSASRSRTGDTRRAVPINRAAREG